jgi:hypothetical protein
LNKNYLALARFTTVDFAACVKKFNKRNDIPVKARITYAEGISQGDSFGNFVTIRDITMKLFAMSIEKNSAMPGAAKQ